MKLKLYVGEISIKADGKVLNIKNASVEAEGKTISEMVQLVLTEAAIKAAAKNPSTKADDDDDDLDDLLSKLTVELSKDDDEATVDKKKKSKEPDPAPDKFKGWDQV